MHCNRTYCWLCWLTAIPLALMIMSLSAARGEELPKGLKVVSLEVRPTTAELKHRFDYRQILVTGKLDSGESVDLTRIAKPQLNGADAAKVASISADGQLRAVGNGNAELVYSYNNLSAKVPVAVAGVEQAQPISFLRDVQPVLSRTGCNQGTCHGAKDGKNGFKLSLRGYDALYDHRALTDDLGARRFNRAAPDQSLMLLKATGSAPHVGGVRMNVEDAYYGLLREWIAQGVKLDLQAPRVTKIDVYPLNPIVPRPDMKQQITVTATYSDGSTRDVTREAFIESGDIEKIEADARGIITTLRRGEAPVLVRYEGAYAATTIICMGDRSGFAWQEPPANNYIDGLIYKKLQQVKILPSELCSDDEFIRRLHIDLTGLPPSAEQVKAFFADTRDSKTKRDALVDSLIGSREYVENWTNKWADMLQVNRKFLGEEGSVALRNWIKDAIAANKPYDQFAREVLTARGSNIENPPAAYYKVLRDPENAMENTTHLFLAVRFNCNKCHDHPFERWTQDQYYNMAAYFAQIGRKEDPLYSGMKIGGSAVEGATPLVEVIYDARSGDINHNRTGQVSPPAFPFAHSDVAPTTTPRRQQLAQWMTSKENQYFAKSYANRLWGYLFGVGIIEPIDDIRAGNPPTNPELLDALTIDFVKSNFDVQHMLRTICKSRTYQLSVKTNQWNDDDGINYSHALPRRLTAETLYDAIHIATGSQPRLQGVPAGFRAAALPDAGISDPFLDDFGKPVRESSCECERSSGMVLGPVLKLINGPTVANALADANSELSKLVTTEKDDTKLIREVFLRFLAREPSAQEIKFSQAALVATNGEVEQAKQELAAYETTLPAKVAAWEATAGKAAAWTPLTIGEAKSQAGATFKVLDDQAVMVSGSTAKDVYTLTANVDLAGITGIRLEALADPALPGKGPGRSAKGNFVLSEFKVTAAPKAEPMKLEPVVLQNATADFSQANWAVVGAIDGNEATGWGVSPDLGKTHIAIFETKTDAGAAGGTVLTFTLSQQYQDGTHALGKFRLSATNSPRPISGGKVPDAIAAILATPKEKRTPEQNSALTAHVIAQDGELARLKNAISQAEETTRNARLIGVQDLAWALINSPAFLFNR
ncbi:hypothetical protein ETAA8_30650 [Anatilimnocola aggregata]|uniref:Uncharacterized protein n=1 Tax=Anatilimnocola aggregata TaxID=2528021 RepID=A0A517YCK7_9BACT|nr:DUF1549 and DUF1553 domain-containing protein [Anatilimnocola aggregata]QDU27973.1 hypothetical protein ETAA8_30650 [Anatilimnocola aggregata]